MTAVCLLLAWWARPQQCRVETLLSVASRPTVLLGEEKPPDAEEIEALRRNQLAYLKSHYVIMAAIRDPAVARLPVLMSKEDPVKWIIENLEVEFPEDSEILTVRMRGPEAMSNDLRMIVDAVSSAYLDEVVFAEDQRKAKQRDALARSFQRMSDELKSKLERLIELKKDSATEKKTEIEMGQMEVESLKKLWQQMNLELEISDVNSIAPARIRLLQPATVTFE